MKTLSILLVLVVLLFVGCTCGSKTAEPDFYHLYFIDASSGAILDYHTFTDMTYNRDSDKGFRLKWTDPANTVHQMNLHYNDEFNYVQPGEGNYRTGNYVMLVTPRETVIKTVAQPDSTQSRIEVSTPTGTIISFVGEFDYFNISHWSIDWDVNWEDDYGNYYLRLPPGNFELEISVTNAEDCGC